MAGAVNALIGDEFGIDLPEKEVVPVDLTVEKNMAKFSQSAEFKKIKAHFEERIVFYQTHLPNGDDIGAVTPTQEQWVAANLIIAELKAVLNMYELANEIVVEAENV